MKQIEKTVETLVLDILKDTKLELVDVEYVKERDWYLRVYIDKHGGIDMDDCQWVSEKLEKRMDELDPIKESYYLEVSSPGLDRTLKKEKDFQRHTGDKVEVHTFAPINGSKKFIGVLDGLMENQVVIKVDENEMSIPMDKISQVCLHIDF